MSAMEQSMGGGLPGCAYDHAQYGERMRKVRAYGVGVGGPRAAAAANASSQGTRPISTTHLRRL